MVRVLCQFPGVRDAISAVPGVEFVDVPRSGPVPAGLSGDVLLAAHSSPALVELADRGVQWVHCYGTGVDSIPVEVFDGRIVTCSRGASAIPIAEFVIAAMLTVEKRMPDVWLSSPPDRWYENDLGEINGKSLGLVGLGGIGTEVATRALALGMQVSATRRSSAPTPVSGVELRPCFDDLLPTSDHLVLAAPATARTRRMLDAAALERVKPGVHIVNVARGSLVDQDALLAALDNGRVRMATLDAVDPEPLPPGHPFFSHPRVRLSAHVSWGSERDNQRIVGMFIDNLRRWVAGDRLEGVVDPVEGY
jgi:phosphoglycerate dehydrogenase-like enzyme